MRIEGLSLSSQLALWHGHNVSGLLLSFALGIIMVSREGEDLIKKADHF